MTRFTPANRAAILARLELGQSLTAAVAGAGLPLPTVKTWLARGRRESGTDYAAFAAQVDAAKPKVPKAGEGPIDDQDELLIVASTFARRGSVPAMRVVWEILGDRRKRGSERSTFIDELAQRRRG